jgi:hypothetical protein
MPRKAKKTWKVTVVKNSLKNLRTLATVTTFRVSHIERLSTSGKLAVVDLGNIRLTVQVTSLERTSEQESVDLPNPAEARASSRCTSDLLPRLELFHHRCKLCLQPPPALPMMHHSAKPLMADQCAPPGTHVPGPSAARKCPGPPV